MAPALIDLFCGAGGMALGFERRGFSTVLASDAWSAAAETYVANHRETEFVRSDVRELEGTSAFADAVKTRPLVIVGGPPCQGFSSAGSKRIDDERNNLVSYYAGLAARVRPDVVVFENVEGFLTAGGGRFVLDFLKPLVGAGYRVRLEKYNVANFGVPQLRKRVIGIAALGRVPQPLIATTSAFGAPGAGLVGVGLPRTETVAEALDGFAPAVESDPLSRVRGLSVADTARVTLLRQGQTMRDLPTRLQHVSYARRANRRVSDGVDSQRRGGAPSGMRRLVGAQPSKAITSAASREFIHPTEHRFLTLRECALLQTFPRDYVFCGNQSQVATLIGNAVPPLFAEAVADAVVRTLSQPLGGASAGLEMLWTSNSGAVSPAMARTLRAVEGEFGTLQ